MSTMLTARPHKIGEPMVLERQHSSSPSMRAVTSLELLPRGRIIGLTSSGARGFPEEVSYGAAKAAQESYTLSAAHELGGYGITANMIHPPVTDTGWVTPAVAEAATAASPLRHVATAEDVAEVIVYLASQQARYVTGQVIRMS